MDVSDPAHPAETGFYDTPRNAYGVAVSGAYAYVADWEGGLRIVDVSDPTHPAEVGSCDTPGYAGGVAVAGGYAYVADGWELRIVDVSEPAAPHEVGFYYGTPADAWGVAVSGAYAYVADDWADLRIIDVSDPAHPSETGSYDTLGTAQDVAVSGAYAYVADGYWGLHIVDVSDPAHPAEAGSYHTPGSAYGVAVSGAYAYVADGDGGLRIVDVANPAHPAEAGSYHTPGVAYDVAVSGAYAYVADGNSGLRIVDVSNPAHPAEAGSCDTPGSAQDVAVSGAYAYVADREGGLRIVDVSDPAHPAEAGSYNTPGTAWGVAVSGAHAYVADRGGGLRIVDVSDPAAPREVGFYDTPGDAWGVAVSGAYAYVADGEGGLVILRFTGSGEPFTGTISPVYPAAHAIPSTVMQGGTAYRHFRLLDSGGHPISGATVRLSSGQTALSDTDGYFTAAVPTDALGSLGNHTVSVQSVTYGGQTYATGGQPSFTIQVTERCYSHAWGYGASSRLKGGVSDGLIAYVQGKNSGGLELTLDESNPSLTTDDAVLMKESYSDEIGMGAGVGLEKGVSIAILQVRGGASASSEFALRTLGNTTARFPNPYESDDKKGQAIFLLASVIDSLQNAFPGKPFGVAFLSSALDRGAPYQPYIIEQQGGTGAKITPLQANVGASASLGLKRGGVTWKERSLGFDLVDVGVSVLTLDTFTDYRERGEVGLGNEADFDFEFSALSWQIGNFKNKFAGTIGDRAKKMRLEIILDADTHEFKRLELSLTGEGNSNAFTDVVKEEVTVKAIIPADQLTSEVLLQTVNVLRLLQAAQQTGNNPLQIGPSAMTNELNALLAPLDYAEYEVTVGDGAQTNYETSLGVTLDIDIELGPGLEVKKTRSLVRERGVFINGHPYMTESYQADSYVTQPGKGWWDLTANALSGLWEYVKDFFSCASQQVTSGVGWVIGIVSRTLDGVVQGGAQITAPPGTQLYTAGVGSEGVTIQQAEPVTITAIGWAPAGTARVGGMGLGPAVATASGEGFVVGGIYAFSPYTLTLSPAATLVITYTDEAAVSVDESRVGMFRWNAEGNNWQPMEAALDAAHNTLTASITQLGTFALGYDDTPPQITILEPADGSIISNTLPLISALVVDEGTGIDPATVEMRLNGQIVAAEYITGTGQLLYLPAEPLASGSYTVTVSAADVMGNVGSASATFTVEVTRRIYLPLVLRNY